jgi:hypothetical protein
MKIFVAMPTLEDSETSLTIQNAYDTASNPEKIYFGIACTSAQEYYDSLIKKIGHYPNVNIMKYNLDENAGVGYGRSNSMKFYEDQEYMLQIDSHTLFEKNWDKILIEMYNKAVLKTNNPKTILTAYLSQYTNTAKYGRLSDKENPKYPRFAYNDHNGLFRTRGIPGWDFTPMNHFSNSYQDEFLPCVKFNANFAFGNKYFIQNTGLVENCYFWEEEILQTINLLGDNFSLVFPNQYVPLFHLYSQDIKEFNEDSVAQRNSLLSSLGENKNNTNIPASNYFNFIMNQENAKKIKIFEDYTMVNTQLGPTVEWYIPKEYSR